MKAVSSGFRAEFSVGDDDVRILVPIGQLWRVYFYVVSFSSASTIEVDYEANTRKASVFHNVQGSLYSYTSFAISAPFLLRHTSLPSGAFSIRAAGGSMSVLMEALREQ